MNGIVIRRLIPADGDLVLSAGDDLFDEPPRPDWTAAALADPAQRIMGAVAGRRLIGFAAGAVVRQPDKPPAFYLNEIGVAEGFRRRGVATALMRAVMDEARGMGCTTVFVLAEAEDDQANDFYRAIGADGAVSATVWEFTV